MTSKMRKQTIRQRQGPRPRRTGVWGRYHWWFIGGGVAVFLVLLAVLSVSLSGPQVTGGAVSPPSPTATSTTSSGSSPSIPVSSTPATAVAASSSSLPDFALTLYQGQEFVGSQNVRFAGLYQGKPLVLNFWASACPPCAAEMPAFEKVWKQYKDRVLFFGLDVGRFAGLGGPETSRQELRRLGITYPAASAPDIGSVQKLGVQGLPSTQFITPSGKVYKYWVGTLNAAKLIEIVEDLLKTSGG